MHLFYSLNEILVAFEVGGRYIIAWPSFARLMLNLIRSGPARRAIISTVRWTLRYSFQLMRDILWMVR